MSLENPFSKKPILPPEETNPDSNIELIGALLGADSAEAYRKTIAGETPRSVAQKPEFNLDAFDDQAFEQHNQVEQGEAETLFKENFLGSKDIENTFSFTIEEKDIPPIPFTRQELKDAQEKGLTLCLNWDTLPDGTLLTGQTMTEKLGGKGSDGGKILMSDWSAEKFFTKEAPRRGWSLTANEATHTSKNYLEQTDALKQEIETDCIGKPMPKIYQDAFAEYEKKKPAIAKLWQDYDKNRKEIAEILSTLEMTGLMRESFSELLQRLIVTERKTKKKLLLNQYAWTSSRSSNGYLVDIGYFGADGACVHGYDPRSLSGLLGVCLSRR